MTPLGSRSVLPSAAVGSPDARLVIVGGGQAAGSALKTLRELDYMGSIVLVSDEAFAPYERPPLSKEYLWGMEQDLRAVAPDERSNEQLLLDRQVVSGDVPSRTLCCSDGSTLSYSALLLATGGVPRRLRVPGAELGGVHALRSAGDALSLRRSIERCRQERRTLLIVGGSWIGLEVAAGARAVGVDVTLVEQGGRLCGRTLPIAAAEWLRRFHVSRGVDVRLGCSVLRLDGDADVRSAQLSDGSVSPVGAVVVGIGIDPNTSLAEHMGLQVRSGIVVDQDCRTSVPEIFAAGDVAEHVCPWHGLPVRIETWDNANRQGAIAARQIARSGAALRLVKPAQALGGDLQGTSESASGGSCTVPPWFWSDQYGVNLQVIGAPLCGDTVLAGAGGNATADSPLYIYLRGDAVIGAVGINRPREMRRLRKLLAKRPDLQRDALTAEGFDVAHAEAALCS